MTEVVVFDTNVLPRSGTLDSPLWLSIRKVCNAANIDIVLPELIVHESLNLRRDGYRVASANFLESFREIERFFEPESVYVPDVEEICSNWETAIREAFEVVPVHGDDAVEALSREALRRRPAREGRGSRDSAIWLTVLRLAETHARVTFVSRNVRDFGKGALHPDLILDQEAAQGDVTYLTSLDAFIESVATAVEKPGFSTEAIEDLLRFDIRDRIHLLISSRPEGAVSPELLAVENVNVSEAQVLRSYTVVGEGLALVRCTGFLVIGDPHDQVQARFSLLAWFEYDAATTTPTLGELHSLDMLPM
jgi:PIN domain